jgi:NAD(P)-dependent dehydrogenase (short-subunit alcohol dehydrogenase family)
VDVRLDGKVALVTGASRGIGLAIATELAASGARVMLSSRKPEALEAAVAGIDGDVAWHAANAGEPDQAAECVDATVDRFGGLDILVNNAATNPYMGPTIDIDLPRFDKTVAVNWRGPLVWTQLAWRAALRDRGGAVLNVASIGGLSVEPSIGIYNGTKAALLHLTRTLAAELAPGVRVNAIAPGLVKTDMARALWEPNEERMAAFMPLARLGEPEDIARASTFLCSDAASWITGTTVIVDGGALTRA